MKALITIKRITEYSSIVEMDEAMFDKLELELDGNWADIKNAHNELNRLIDTKDWQDDEFHELVEFGRVDENSNDH